LAEDGAESAIDPAEEPAPALDPPPGLEDKEDDRPPGLEDPPPGLEAIAVDMASSKSKIVAPATWNSSTNLSGVMHQVQLIGLPNELLSEPAFQAVLEQAQLEGFYSGVTLSQGKLWGEAVIDLTDEFAVGWCVQHFHGRSWAADGTPVSACILAREDLVEEVHDESDESWLEAWYKEACRFGLGLHSEDANASVAAEVFPLTAEESPPSVLSADAPTLVTKLLPPSELSANAPIFVPGEKIIDIGEKIPASDVSTVDAESECDEIKAVLEAFA